MSNRRRTPRHARPLPSRRAPRLPPRLVAIGYAGPDGEEIEVTIDINDPMVDPFLVDLFHLMSDDCPHCNAEDQEDNGDGQ